MLLSLVLLLSLLLLLVLCDCCFLLLVVGGLFFVQFGVVVCGSRCSYPVICCMLRTSAATVAAIASVCLVHVAEAILGSCRCCRC